MLLSFTLSMLLASCLLIIVLYPLCIYDLELYIYNISVHLKTRTFMFYSFNTLKHKNIISLILHRTIT